ncbi:MAG TPA: lysophospholipase [Bacteroidales bacterium]|nr:alpha/beta fold hydrolase [Bacteroidales bacterium]HNR41183.1 lysophospholipase [Bacteroidales bacterium]HPM18256.1 lysophospholipase [Bacteroidales bacterium]HQG77202.1 lysophospholipase [Bacteroidales bacterium]
MDINIKISNGQVLRGFIRNPGGRTKAVIIMVHGLGEHIGRYSFLADIFMKNEIGFAGADLPGHGRSDGSRGYIRDYGLLYEMLDILQADCRKIFPGIPLFLYGHSLGGGIVLSYLLKKNPPVNGAIVTSPWLKLSDEPSPFKKKLAALAGKILPSVTIPNGIDPQDISNDSNVVKEYNDDPLNHDRISLSLATGAFRAAGGAIREAHLLTKPLLLMHGSDDRICSPEGSTEFAAASRKAELKIWKGGFHELHNDLNRSEVIDYVISWIMNRIS